MNTWKPALLPEDPEKNKKFLAEYGLVPSLVLIDNFGDRMFRHGAYSTSQKDVQKENMKPVSYTHLLNPVHTAFWLSFMRRGNEGARWKRP